MRQKFSEPGILLLVFVSLGWFLIMGSRLVYPALLPQIKNFYSMDNTMAGFIMTALWLAYAAFQFPSGYLADWAGKRTTVLLSVVLVSAALLIISLVPSFAGFMGGTLLFGVGSGLYTTPRVTLLTEAYPHRRGAALGVSFAAGNFGTSLLPIVAGMLAAHYFWQSGFLFIVPLLLASGAGLWVVVPGAKRGTPAETTPESATQRKQAYRDALNTTILLGGVTFSINSFGYQGLTAFLPIFLLSEKGLSKPVVSLLFGVFFATGACFQLLASALTDRFTMKQILVGTTACSAVGLLALTQTRSVYAVTVSLLVMSTFLGLGPVLNRYLVEICPSEVEGTVYGLIRTIGVFVGSTGSLFVGSMADRHLLAESFLIMFVLTAIMCGLFFLVRPTDSV